MAPRTFAALILIATLACNEAGNNPIAPSSEVGIDTRRVKDYPARVDLGTLGGNVSYANAINASGVVVGSSETGSGQTLAFRWTLAGGLVPLSTLPGDDGSAAADIDDQGNILGVSFSGPFRHEGEIDHPVMWDPAGNIHALVLPFAIPSGFDAVTLIGLPNTQNQWAGTANVAGSCCTTDAAVFYSAVTDLVNLRTLGEASGIDGTVIGDGDYNEAIELNERGTLVGLGGPEDGWRTFLWSPAAGFQLPGIPPGMDPVNTTVVPAGLNNLDEVIGAYQTFPPDAQGSSGPFRWSGKKGFTLLPGGGGSDGYAMEINDKGEAVGATFLNGAFTGAAWPHSGNIKLLATRVGNSSIVLDINNDGLAVGWEGSGSGLDNHAVLWNTALAHVVPGGKANGPNFASRARGPKPASNAFEAKVARCLSHPSSKTARAVCFAR